MKHEDAEQVSGKAQTEHLTASVTGRDVPVKGAIAIPASGESPESWVRTQRLLDRLLWQAFTKRGRHENNVR